MVMEALLSSFNSMEMKSGEMPESGTQQKPEPEVNQNPMGKDDSLEQKTDEIPGSGVSLEPVEACQGTVVEADVNPEKQIDEIQGSEVNSEPVETCDETVVQTDVTPEKQVDPKAIPEVDQKPIETSQETVTETEVAPEKQIAHPGVIYRCKRCRQMVATQEYVVTHEVGRGDGKFGTRKKLDADEDDKKPECSLCIFVEPMKWMQAVQEGYVSQKLHCMGCKALLGQFDWSGIQCTCGTWVIPAFQLTKSKIDECSM
ncbi:hypothetical protein EJB05_25076 [Eragrostis curvula]|uniref:Uncharacterized protein n=1 Tax=Eragrostis curvula TaxID=38414 RepID=A0A5J9VB43_9POAL|nr:hypothetical protein EJB05_25076 [Eragrostis curvula]